ncbi:MAG: hypothetical protein N3F05_01770 [Candidatus Diapherotrites archaeon]|nr:hypothetical protein [Candidatus Diapherotrites archaeon]
MLNLHDKEKIIEIRTWAFAIALLFLVWFVISAINFQNIWNGFLYSFKNIGFVNLLPSRPPIFLLFIVIMPIVYFIVNKYSKNETIKRIAIINAILLPTLLFFEYALNDMGNPDLTSVGYFPNNLLESLLYSYAFGTMSFYLWVLFLLLIIFALLSPIVENAKMQRKTILDSLAVSFGFVFILFSICLSNFVSLSQYAVTVDQARLYCYEKTNMAYPSKAYPEIYDVCYWDGKPGTEKLQNIMNAREYFNRCFTSKLPISDQDIRERSLALSSLLMAIICLVLGFGIFRTGRLKNEMIGKGTIVASFLFWFISYDALQSYIPIQDHPFLIAMLAFACWFAIYYLLFWLASKIFISRKQKSGKGK